MAASIHRQWPLKDTISMFGADFTLDRYTLKSGAFALKIDRGTLKWPLKRESRLKEVAETAGLTVFVWTLS